MMDLEVKEMNRRKRELIESSIVAAVIMSYVALIAWIRTAGMSTPLLVIFCIVSIFLGLQVLMKS